MRRKLLTAFILFLLTACAAQTPTPTATAAIYPIPTATLLPTATVVSTPTLSSEQQVALDGMNYTLNGKSTVLSDGSIIDKEGIIIPDLKYDIDTAMLMLKTDKGFVAIRADALSLDEKGRLKVVAGFKNENNTWIALTNNEKLDIRFTQKDTVSVGGIVLDVVVSVDKTANIFDIHSVTIAPDILGELSARALHNFFVPSGVDNNNEAVAWLKSCKAGNPAERTDAIYTTTGGMEPENLRLVMDCGQDVPEGAVGIRGVEFVYGKWWIRTEVNGSGVYSTNLEMPWLDIIIKSSGMISGMMLDKKEGKLILFQGFSFFVPEGKEEIDCGTSVEVSLDWMKKYPRGIDLKMSEIQYKRALRWYGAIRVK